MLRKVHKFEGSTICMVVERVPCWMFEVRRLFDVNLNKRNVEEEEEGD